MATVSVRLWLLACIIAAVCMSAAVGDDTADADRVPSIEDTDEIPEVYEEADDEEKAQKVKAEREAKVRAHEEAIAAAAEAGKGTGRSKPKADPNKKKSRRKLRPTPPHSGAAHEDIDVEKLVPGHDTTLNYHSMKFIREKRQDPDTFVLPSGLSMKRLKEGFGIKSPTMNSPCVMLYKGMLHNGTVFDSVLDADNPFVAKPKELVEGWEEALEYMVEGDKWELHLPPALAYGPDGTHHVPKYAALHFEVELLKVRGNGKPASEARAILDDEVRIAQEDGTHEGL